ncbi:MAG: acyltransferase [Chloroflexi bacterium]|nr:acyltransferase [Chloroflexota bacterium]
MNQAYTIGFASVGQDVTVWPLAKVVFPEKITVGDCVIIDDFVFIMGGNRTSIGSFVHIAAFCSIAGGGELCMADFTGLSGGVRVYTGNEDYSGGCLTNPTVPPPFRMPVRSKVVIEKHAIVGANSVILPGVTIGEGAVVGANSLVTKNCQPWTVYFGSPALAIGSRPAEKIRTLELSLREQFYDQEGRYVPIARRNREII